MSDSEALVRMHRAARARLAERLTTIHERREKVRATLEKLDTEQAELEGERDALAKAEMVYRRMFSWPNDKPVSLPVSEGHAEAEREPRQRRARLGTQRFLMFQVLAHVGIANQNWLAVGTKLPARRVREQMISDIRLGLVGENEEGYYLTPAGLDLHDRFVAYRQAAGKPLPSLENPSDEDDQDEAGTPESMEGATQE